MGIEGGCYVIAGDLIPVAPGELIKTKFYLDTTEATTGIWHASISSASGATSHVEVPFPFMQHDQRWVNRNYYPSSCSAVKVTVTAPAGTSSGWQQKWRI